MAHVLVVGCTMSGKSTYAKWVCAGLKKKGIRTLVCNPYFDPEWDCETQFHNAHDLLQVARAEKSCAIFLEEAGDTLKRELCFNWFTCRARHWGHKVWVITQRLQDLNPALRNNCTEAVVFASRQDDCDTLASEYREPLLRDVEKFPKGQFYSVGQFADTLIGQLDFRHRRILARTVRKVRA